MRNIICIFFLLFISLPLFSQDKEPEFFITINGNLYVPINNPDRGMYPILGYDKETDTKILIGGLGVGASYFHPITSKISLKGLANLNKNTYWDKPIDIRDIAGNPYPAFLAGSSDYSLVLGAITHFYVTEKISIGTGFSGQMILVSLSRMPALNSSETSVVVNKFYKPIIPLVPLEISMKLNSTLINIRYEQALINPYKGDLGKYKKDKHGILIFELGIII